MLARLAIPKTIGIKKAVEAVLLMKAPSTAEETITTIWSRHGSSPVCRTMYRPTTSITPVRIKAAVRMRRPRIMITVVTAEAGESAVGRHQAAQHQGKQQPERGDIGLQPLRGKEHDRQPDEGEEEADLEGHPSFIALRVRRSCVPLLSARDSIQTGFERPEQRQE